MWWVTFPGADVYEDGTQLLFTAEKQYFVAVNMWLKTILVHSVHSGKPKVWTPCSKG